ncbi:MAG TPA: alkaline phosphatase family protein [Chloroflexota bacterium]|jgi:phospholipase C
MTALSRVIPFCLALGGGLGLSAVASGEPASQHPTTPIEHLVVICLENWSFDGLYGTFPGADGLVQGPGTPQPSPQANKTGVPLASVGQVTIQNDSCATTVPTTPLPNRPFDLSPIVPPHCKSDDPEHRFYNEQYQINGGSMDRFVAWDELREPALVMSYYDMTGSPCGPR